MQAFALGHTGKKRFYVVVSHNATGKVDLRQDCHPFNLTVMWLHYNMKKLQKSMDFDEKV